ncbi:uncharacterized protein isoform X1 [Choristoneura fumiferana]|uniref:uncharacterized protein isoform X1 n=1 Tax=Choristoneura fumiferana TaxID=7141 RepID=UPI003D15D96F
MGYLLGQNVAILVTCVAIVTSTGFFEYGYHVLNEKLAFKYRGQIPAFTSVYKLPVRHNRSDMYIRYTYLRVEFGKKLSKVDTDYDQAEQILIFKVQYTLLPIDIGVTGYALQVANFSQVWPHEKGMEEYT